MLCVVVVHLILLRPLDILFTHLFNLLLTCCRKWKLNSISSSPLSDVIGSLSNNDGGGYRKASLKKWIRAASNFSFFRKRKRKLLSCVLVLDKTWTKALSRCICATAAKKCTKQAWCTWKVEPIAFLPFSLPSPTTLLKLPNIASKVLQQSFYRYVTSSGSMSKIFTHLSVQLKEIKKSIFCAVLNRLIILWRL